MAPSFLTFFDPSKIENHGAHTLLGKGIQLFIPLRLLSKQVRVIMKNCLFQPPYMGWTLSLAFLLRLVGHTLCSEQLHNCLFQPLYTCARTNL